MIYSLMRLEDGVGDSGPMCKVIDFETRTEVLPSRPRIGCIVRVGSPYARSYQAQDFWQTSPVTKIIEDTPEKVIFETLRSTYIWTCLE